MGKEERTVSNVVMCIPFSRYAIITVTLPAVSLFYCLVSALMFAKPQDILDTDCNVTNNIPSVSAVTGVKPQAYVWRVCIGLHSAPRFFVGFMYYNYYLQSLPYITKGYQGLYKFLTHLCFALYTIECSCLLFVSCISNKENYSMHEKIFVCFMIASIAYQVFATILFRWSRSQPMTDKERKSFFWKKVMLFSSSVSTIGLIIFFIQHRFHCIPGAFSIFSVFEYLIAYANMGYHLTGYYEFSHKVLLSADLNDGARTNGTNGTVHSDGPVKNGRRKVE